MEYLPTVYHTSNAPSRMSSQPIRNSRKPATRGGPSTSERPGSSSSESPSAHRRREPVRSHARRALSEGESREEVRHVGLLALTTIGFPHTIAGLSWIEEVIETAK